MKNVFEIRISSKAKKQLMKLPSYIIMKLNSWVEAVNHSGIREVRKIVGYHDEPLIGNRKGQRPIRLSKGYRAIYIEDDRGRIHFLEIIEVHKHDY